LDSVASGGCLLEFMKCHIYTSAGIADLTDTGGATIYLYHNTYRDATLGTSGGGAWTTNTGALSNVSNVLDTQAPDYDIFYTPVIPGP